VTPKSATVRHAGERPENADEGHQRQRRVDDADREIDRHLRRAADILGDALIRILDAFADEIELVVPPAFEPAAGQPRCEPAPPAQL